MDTNKLKDELAEILKLEARERFKKLKKIGYSALHEFKSSQSFTLEDLKNYIEIFKTVAKSPSISTAFNIAIGKATGKYLSMLGCENVPVLFKKSTAICLESALIAIGDGVYSIEYVNASKASEVELINSGKCFFFSTGSDGKFNIQLRIVDASEPVLTAKEYKNVVAASPVIFLHFPSGKLLIGDGKITSDKSNLQFDIHPGYYKCQVFIFKFAKSFSYYIVLSKTNEEKENNETEVITLEE